MKDTIRPTEEVPEAPNDLSLPGGCPLCGGDLTIRLGEGGAAASYCPTCRWLSHPTFRAAHGSVTVIHPAGGLA